MNDLPYQKLADALNTLPNGFPRTEKGWEIAILKKIASPEEADLASRLSSAYETVQSISERTSVPFKEARRSLLQMAKKGLVRPAMKDGQLSYRLAPFIVGIYEDQVETIDHELAHLVEHYLAEGGAEGIMKPHPALQRVVPAQGSVKSEWILPYDDVKAMLLSARNYRIMDCICRKQQDLLEKRKCDFPLHTCFVFTDVDRPPRPDDVSREEALAVLDKTEELGLVHSVSNVVKGVYYICNCCGCCCGILRGITELGIEESVAHANYVAVIYSQECVGCGTCRERCQVAAIREDDGVMVVDADRCIGCGLCVTGCPNEVVHLIRKPDSEIVHPPSDMGAWEELRLKNRESVQPREERHP